jgi:hypothetical protein
MRDIRLSIESGLELYTPYFSVDVAYIPRHLTCIDSFFSLISSRSFEYIDALRMGSV